jgi:hypothetical protein
VGTAELGQRLVPDLPEGMAPRQQGRRAVSINPEFKTFRAGRVSGEQSGYLTLSVAEAVAAGAKTVLCDCSEFQSNIDDAIYLAWSRAIVIRSLYGSSHTDKAWYGGARRSALHQGGARFVGIYAFLVAGQDGAAQARAFHSLVGAIQPGEVFIADCEQGTKAMLTAWYNEMVKLYGNGIKPYLWTYTGLSFGQDAGLLPVQWIAAYQSAEPSTPHTLWQFSEAYAVPGVGTADCSIYHGTIDQLAALAYGGHQLNPVEEDMTPAVAYWDGKIYRACIGTDKRVYWQTAGSTKWEAVGTWKFKSGCALAISAVGEVTIAAEGQDGEYCEVTRPAGNGTWGPWKSLGGKIG